MLQANTEDIGLVDNEASTDELIYRVAEHGDLNAFNHLVRMYQGTVYNVAYRILSDSEDAADATQNAFLAAYRNIGNFRGGSFRAWILRIVTNQCYDILRGSKNAAKISLDDDEHGTENYYEQWLAHKSGLSPEEAIQKTDFKKAIQKGLFNMPSELRAVVVLIDIHGLEYQEVSRVLRKPLGTVKSRLSRGRAQLRKYLDYYISS